MFKNSIIPYLFFIFIFVVGFITGRGACSKHITSDPIILTVEIPPVDSGGGLLTPVDTNYVTPIDSTLIMLNSIWFEWEDDYLKVKVRAINADSFEYKFKKRWVSFKPTSPYIRYLSVYGVSPESTKTQVIVPNTKKNLALITTITSFPNLNGLICYKSLVFHIQSPLKVDKNKLSYGLGYCYRF